MRIVIIGAGISGLMAYRYFKNKGHDAVVIEKNTYTGSLQNHSAIFRTRTRAVSDILKCNVKEIVVEKGYISSDGKFYIEPTIDMKNEYSIKVSDRISFRSIYKDRTDDERLLLSGIEPIPEDDLADETSVESISNGEIFCNGLKSAITYDFCISTIPLPYMLKIANIKSNSKFEKKEIIVFRYNISIESEVYQTLYFTNPSVPIYRATLQERELIIECMSYLYGPDNNYETITKKIFGIDPSAIKFDKKFKMPFGKIIPICDMDRRKMIMELSDKHNIFSLGRHAIWKNNVAADEVADDIKKIERMMTLSDTQREYERRLER